MLGLYIILYRFIAVVHLVMLTLNLISVPLLVINEPFYIWMPLITFLASPLVGGTYCLFNRIENHFRKLANKPTITDRIDALLKNQW